ncbi:MAG: ATP-binding cassette domain-containing protein [Lachnospiraceae bacterium]|nr:ATP-binding cassette domain-containing protein [Lachnospiraceae bacterium]
MEYVVKVENVSKNFKNEQVLKDVSVCFEKGKIYGIVGKNGSGKTMLFKTIIGYVRPSFGKVYVKEKEIGKDMDFAENVGVIIETPGFLSGYSAYKNLEYLAAIRNKVTKQQIKEAISLVGLDAESTKKVGKFSLGMRQRLGIAQAIMENPDLIILDEPMNGLDKQGIVLVKELLLRLKKEGKTVLLASHYAEDMEICDEIYEMDAGCLTKKVFYNQEEIE